MNGAPVLIARSITLHTFCAMTSPIEPPNTVKSWLETKTLRPSTVPYPVITPSPGGCFFSIPKSCARWIANGSVSTNEPLSIRISSRSRAVSLPRSCCFLEASRPPGVRAPFFRLRSSSMRASTVIVGSVDGTSLSVVAMAGSLILGVEGRPQQPRTGQPADAQPPMACTIRSVTMALVLPLRAVVCRCHPAFAQVR